MSLTENMISVLGFDSTLLACVGRYTIFGRYGGYFEGVTGIKCYCPEQIIFTAKNSEIKLTGCNMEVVKFCGGDAAVKGKIYEIKFSGKDSL